MIGGRVASKQTMEGISGSASSLIMTMSVRGLLDQLRGGQLRSGPWTSHDGPSADCEEYIRGTFASPGNST